MEGSIEGSTVGSSLGSIGSITIDGMSIHSVGSIVGDSVCPSLKTSLAGKLARDIVGKWTLSIVMKIGGKYSGWLLENC